MELLKEFKEYTTLLKSAVSKDETRLNLKYIFHNPNLKAAVTTDGSQMIVSQIHYIKELAGKLFDPVCFSLGPEDLNYPSVEKVTHFNRPINTYDYHFHWEAKTFKALPAGTKLYFYKDNTKEKTVLFSIAELPENETLAVLDVKYLKKLPAGIYPCWIEGKTSPVVFSLYNYIDSGLRGYFVVMPIGKV